jgi:hypothetical protein
MRTFFKLIAAAFAVFIAGVLFLILRGAFSYIFGKKEEEGSSTLSWLDKGRAERNVTPRDTMPPPPPPPAA